MTTENAALKAEMLRIIGRVIEDNRNRPDALYYAFYDEALKLDSHRERAASLTPAPAAPEGDREVCPECKGTGRESIMDSENPCPECRGKGYLTGAPTPPAAAPEGQRLGLMPLGFPALISRYIDGAFVDHEELWAAVCYLRSDGRFDNLRYVPDLVKNAMLTVWNEICADTGNHPLDIEHGKGKFLTFTPRHWAQMAGDMVQVQIEKLLAPTPPTSSGDKLTIAELETILASDDQRIHINPDGSLITVDAPKVQTLDEVLTPSMAETGAEAFKCGIDRRIAYTLKACGCICDPEPLRKYGHALNCPLWKDATAAPTGTAAWDAEKFLDEQGVDKGCGIGSHVLQWDRDMLKHYLSKAHAQGRAEGVGMPETELRRLIDVTWQTAMESEEVPGSQMQDYILDRANLTPHKDGTAS